MNRNHAQNNLLMNAISKITSVTVVPASIFILSMMMLIVVRIFFRLIRIGFRGSYEIIEVIAVLVTTCSIVYAAAKGSKILVDILISRFSLRGKVICMVIADIVGIAFWALVAYASVWYTQTFGAGEASMDLNIPYTPFKIFWAMGLLIYCLVIFWEVFKTVTDKEKK